MFYYLSFLRPPPTHEYPSSSHIKITPQIANDLRTEQFPHPQDIYYAWLPATPQPINIQPKKLCTWKPEGAYKEIPVPLPSGLRENQQWKLLLTSSVGMGGVDLVNHTGKGVIPVLSMPVLFGRSRGSKQERIERFYRLSTCGEVKRLKVVEQTSFDLDKKIWDGGIGLSSWIVGLASSTDVSDELKPLKNALLAKEGRRILELGTGIGLVALTICAIRSSLLQKETEGEKVYATDVESAMPLLEENITSNALNFPHSIPQARVLDWDEELPDYAQELKEQGRLDLIVMADVTYNTASFPSLIRTIEALVNLSPEHPPLILMGYKERDTAERELWDLAKEVGVVFERIGERKGWEGKGDGREVEVWLGRFRK